ncbi:S8 family serine peptidase [Chamaesiphon sp. VAR_48_metabat_135_sub]|uniref:S8 family serine peptidase n=1 Tax=Chamaesiphon sp. VAR_48_metabat_135_sub TaxID=2964699 RepID=UPI00286B78AB|nr:S8 family serine peptidase [Chamaesiphon sp. VAR_48_metabat_135_sub]
MSKYWQRIAIWVSLTSTIAPSWALPTANSIGSAGIDALRLHQSPYNLTGKKIAIGQVEIGRPAQFGWDKAAKDPTFKLEQIFYQDGEAKANTNVEDHSMMVAAVMISQDKRFPGVAPAARLYATAMGTVDRTGQPEECRSIQHIAQQNGGDIRAINLSFGEPLGRDPRPNPKLDGNALLTQCLDWSARVHNVTYLVAGNQGKGGVPIPTDNYNGINVAYSLLRQEMYTKLGFSNLSEMPTGTAKKIKDLEVNVDNRRSISLVAPGNLQLYNLAGKPTSVNGTSFAVPHVTGTVALLQEFGDRQLRTRSQMSPDVRSHWTLDSRRHEVMKAVLLNSADKIQDLGDGLRLGMTRTMLAKNNRDWLESEAYGDRHVPLDYQLGAGQLNAFRAYQQFSPGQYHPISPVPAIGWDYRTVDAGVYRDYHLDRSLAENSWVSISLTWDRLVELADPNLNNEYDVGETFRDRGLNQLDLYLMPADEDRLDRSLWSSTSSVDSVQHIFHQIRDPGKYKIRVHFRQALNVPHQAYALAWWTVPTLH